MLKYAVKGRLGRNIPLQNTRCSWVALDWKRRKKCKLRSTVTAVFFFCISGRCYSCCCCCRFFTPCRGMRIPETGKFFLMESGIPGSGIRSAAQTIQNPTNGSNPGCKFSWQGICNLVPGIRNPWRGDCLGFLYMERVVFKSKAETKNIIYRWHLIRKLK